MADGRTKGASGYLMLKPNSRTLVMSVCGKIKNVDLNALKWTRDNFLIVN